MKTSGPTYLELFLQATSSTKQGYNLLAPQFNATPYATPSSFVARSLDRAETRFPRKDSDENWGADLACGTGVATAELANFCNHVDGFDFSPGMLQQARQLLERKAEGSVVHQLFEVDLATVELPCSAYRRVITFGAWGHILPLWRERLVEQIVNSLAPGGVFLTITADPGRVASRRWWYSIVFDAAIHLRNRILSEPFHMYYRINDTLVVKQLFENDSRVRVFLEPVPGSPHPELTLLMVQKLE